MKRSILRFALLAVLFISANSVVTPNQPNELPIPCIPGMPNCPQ